MTGIKSDGRPAMSLRVLLAILPLMIILSATPAACNLEGKEQSEVEKFEGKVNAPEFPEHLEWLNTGRRLGLKDLRGKIVMLDFWTYCCINCMHVIPDLKKLEAKYAGELVVIGVHSAKFTTERETDNIRQAILRYGIAHPVINDSALEVWRSYAVHSWPTIMLVDPRGKVVGYHSGEGVFDAFDEFLSEMIAYWDGKGGLDRSPLDLQLERESVPRTLLSFPGKVLADEQGGRLFISDSNNNRVVVVSLNDHSVLEVIGGREVGFKDGVLRAALFNHPQGMAVDGDKLYVADTENHAIRLADLKAKTVKTLAGTGAQARTFNVAGPGRETALNSPWDLQLSGGSLYIAMAGSHQLWVMDTATGHVKPYAGSGREARVDDRLLRAALAQPSGLTTDGTKLYFADSEISSIRSADLAPDGTVETIAGGDLFEYGDVDGIGDDARFQHPLGVAYHDGALLVADTYNNKIRRVDLATRKVTAFLGNGDEGMRDGREATFDEPGGLSIASGKLYIADTNNHLIRVADLGTREVSTLVIKGIDKLAAASPSVDPAKTIKLPARSISPGKAELVIALRLPAGFKLNDLGPSRLTAEVSEGGLELEGTDRLELKKPAFPLTIPATASAGEHLLTVDYVIYYCSEGNEGMCFVADGRIQVPVLASEGNGDGRIEIELEISATPR